MTAHHLRLGFLASRNGSAMRAILSAIACGDLSAEARLVVSNNRQAPALAHAAGLGLPTCCIPTKSDPEAADVALTQAMEAAGADLIVLSGYLRKLGPVFLRRFAGRVLNIHPGPLPQFGGEGMYGRRVHEAVLAAGVPESAAVIHLVDGDYDQGPEIARVSAPVLADDTPETLEARITALEPPLFVRTLQDISRGALPLP